MKLVSVNISINIIVGDITEFTGDAIVNPANTFLVMGGGVAGAIKRKGGIEIEEEAKRYAPLPIGKAVATTAGKLRCKAIIHAPTVEKPGSISSFDNVYRATKAALEYAKKHMLRSLAFPLMGAGVGGLTIEQSVDAMVKAFREAGEGLNIYVYVLDKDVAQKVVQHLISLGFKRLE